MQISSLNCSRMNLTLICLWHLALLFMAAIFKGDSSIADLQCRLISKPQTTAAEWESCQTRLRSCVHSLSLRTLINMPAFVLGHFVSCKCSSASAVVVSSSLYCRGGNADALYSEIKVTSPKGDLRTQSTRTSRLPSKILLQVLKH